jgi:ABC-type uncharacterized transport system permease subunit
MEELSQVVYDWFKKFSPYILVGAIGAVVHRLRTEMTWKQFAGSLFISVLVSLSVGIVSQEYTILGDDIIFVLCGISGTFSKLLLDEIEEIIADLSTFFKEKFLNKKSSDEDKHK